MLFKKQETEDGNVHVICNVICSSPFDIRQHGECKWSPWSSYHRRM